MNGLPIIPFEGADPSVGRNAPTGRESPLAKTITRWPRRSSSCEISATTSSMPPYADGGTGYQGGAMRAIFIASLAIAGRCRVFGKGAMEDVQEAGDPHHGEHNLALAGRSE